MPPCPGLDPPLWSTRLSVRLQSVCPRTYLWSRWTIGTKFCVEMIPMWPWLCPPPAALRYVMYFRSRLVVIGATPITAKRLSSTSVRDRGGASTNACLLSVFISLCVCVTSGIDSFLYTQVHTCTHMTNLAPFVAIKNMFKNFRFTVRAMLARY